MSGVRPCEDLGDRALWVRFGELLGSPLDQFDGDLGSALALMSLRRGELPIDVVLAGVLL